jgi:hypothetical protein
MGVLDELIVDRFDARQASSEDREKKMKEDTTSSNRTILWIGLGALALLLLCACVLAILIISGLFTFGTFGLPTVGQEPSPPPTSEALGTSTPPPQTAAPPALAPSTEPVDEDFERASRFAGDWEGQWINQTFGSSGAARGTVSIDPDGTASLFIDLDGFVFGIVDPPAKTYEGTYSSEGAHFEKDGDDLFGNVQIDVDSNGTMTVNGEMVPVEGVASFSASGTLTETSLNLDYLVQFPGGGEANGVIEMSKQAQSDAPEPVTEFLEEFEAAMQSENLDFLLGRLHPAVIDRYGESACAAYLAQVAEPTFSIEVLRIHPPDDWTYGQDGVEALIEMAWSAEVRVSSGGQIQETTAHYAERDGTLRWFTDCGTPLSS